MVVENRNGDAFILDFDFYLVVFVKRMENLVVMKNIVLEKNVSEDVSQDQTVNMKMDVPLKNIMKQIIFPVDFYHLDQASDAKVMDKEDIGDISMNVIYEDGSTD